MLLFPSFPLMKWLNVNTAVCNRKTFMACILIIALTYCQLPRAVVYTPNGAVNSSAQSVFAFHGEGAHNHKALAQWKDGIIWDYMMDIDIGLVYFGILFIFLSYTFVIVSLNS